jgi:GT2 family glycosyltransferase
MRMSMSLVVCSRNRAGQLAPSLAALNLEAMARLGVDLVLVDSASEDATSEIMVVFARACGVAVQVLRADRPGASRARNLGARAAKGEWLIFTDDDCHLAQDYFDALAGALDPARFQYGGGDTRVFDPGEAATGVTPLDDGPVVVPPRSLWTAGAIQAANLFILREAFERLGGFDEALGAGTPFPCEDVDLCTRASLSGYVGVLLPQARVLHHHGRRPGSPELAAAEQGYDRGRGAYYVRLMAMGQDAAWGIWSKLHQTGQGGPMTVEAVERLRNEMRGAADYLDMVLSRRN